MKIAIMQPYFMPYIGYWQLINAVDKFVIYDDVQFIKGGWINRNNILLNGEKHLFNLILEGASANKMINEIYIKKDQKKLLKTISNNYNKTQYFNTIFPIIEQVFENTALNLAHFIGMSIIEICKYLKINTQIVYSSELQKDSLLKGQDKVIDICKKLKTIEYINAIGGQELYSKETFKRNNINLFFLKTNSIEYLQLKNNFVPWLSIIDVMMFNSVEEIKSMLNKYELI